MAKIKAHGQTEYGDISVEITGQDKVQSVETGSWALNKLFMNQINKAEHSVANGYYPEAGTMLQAYAFCIHIFHEDDVTVEGDIGELEWEEGVLY